MDRDTLKDGMEQGFGSPEYAREELRAEISAMMTGERVGVGHDPQRGGAYVENWVKVLEEDPREIHRAAAEAQRMSDYLIGRVRGRSLGSVENKPCSVNAASWFPSVMSCPLRLRAGKGDPRCLAPGAAPLHPLRSSEPVGRG